MGRTRTFDLEGAIGTATTLFWRGYDQTSLADLTGGLGIGAASFYFAFESKEKLFREVVGRSIAALEAAYEDAFRDSSTRKGVEKLLRHYADVVTDPAHTPGCLVVNSSPAVQADGVVKPWLSGHREALRVRLEERFIADMTDGVSLADADPKTLGPIHYGPCRRHRRRSSGRCEPGRSLRDDRSGSPRTKIASNSDLKDCLQW